MIVCNKLLAYVSSVYTSAGRTLESSYDHLKLKFNTAFNAPHCQSHRSYFQLVSIKLVKGYCLQLLLYAVESTAAAKQVVRVIGKCVDVGVRKIFKLSCFEDCRFVMSRVSLHPIAELIRSRTVKFMSSVVDNQVLSDVAQWQLAFNELFTFAS